MSSSTSSLIPTVFYYTYLNFAENTLAFICTLTAIIHMSKLLYATKFNKPSLRVDSFAGTMKVYLAVNICCGTLTLPYFFYKVFWWRPPFIHGEEPIYANVLLHFTCSIFYALHYGVSSILVFTLCLDRCFVVIGNLHYGNNIRRRLVIAEIIIVVIVYIVCGSSYYFEFPLDYHKLSYSESQSGMQLHLKNYPILFVKTCFGVSNIFCCIVFIYLLSKLGKEAKKKLDNRIIKITVLIEIFLNVIPGEGNIIYKFITGTTPSTYTGELALLGFSMEIAICSVFYCRKYKYTKKETQVIMIRSQEDIQKKISTKQTKF